MELYYSFSILIVIAALFSYINVRFIKLPGTIGIMIIAMVASIIARVVGETFFPELTMDLRVLLNGFNFTEVLMGAMLNFLLFAGAMHVNLSDLKSLKWTIATYSTFSVVISAFLVGGMLFYLAPLFGFNIPFVYCLLFGTLISPTDPIVVLGILKQAKVPKMVETKITGESLFNDGVAVVMFAVVMQIATSTTFEPTFFNISKLFLLEAGGGVLLGLALGWTASYCIKKIDEYDVTTLITLSIVMGGFLIAKQLHLSSPIAMVVAGLIIGNYGKQVAMSKETKDYLGKFWELVDEILNAILFLFIGLELLVLDNVHEQIWLGFAAVVIVVLARAVSIVIPAKTLLRRNTFSKGSLGVLIWGGIRGGVSIALVMSLPNGEWKNLLLEVTYIVVMFSIIVQGLTVGPLAKRILKTEDLNNENNE